MKKLLFLFIATSLLYSCSKDPAAPNPDTTPKDSVNVYVPIYEPGDTSQGAAYGKKLNTPWKARAVGTVLTHFDTNYLGVVLSTYTTSGYKREELGFWFIPKLGILSEEFRLETNLTGSPNDGFVSSFYGTWISDGDVAEDDYYVDTTATDNLFRVTKFDWAHKIMECSFTVTFIKNLPSVNPKNPQKVKFVVDKAWMVIRE